MRIRRRLRPVAPRIERRVAAIWCEVLGVTVVDPDADFFALGGTSLQAVQVIGRLEEMIGRPVPAAALLEGRTLRALADAVAAGRGERAGS